VQDVNYPALSFYILWSASMFGGVYWYERAIKAEKQNVRIIAVGYGNTPEDALACAKKDSCRYLISDYGGGYVLLARAKMTALVPLQ